MFLIRTTEMQSNSGYYPPRYSNYYYVALKGYPLNFRDKLIADELKIDSIKYRLTLLELGGENIKGQIYFNSRIKAEQALEWVEAMYLPIAMNGGSI